MKITMTIEFDNLEEAHEFFGQRGKSTEIPQISPKTVEKRAVMEKTPQRAPEELPAEILPTPSSDWPFEPEVDTLENINPGDPHITKIGTAARTQILDDLRAGRQPDPKYTEHLKLLWHRGEVKFDGTLFRI